MLAHWASRTAPGLSGGIAPDMVERPTLLERLKLWVIHGLSYCAAVKIELWRSVT
jgi:hypothetical protein